MSILIDGSSRVLVQGMTGREGSFHTERMLAAGSLPARELHRLIVRVSDRPGVFQAIMVALGDAGINIEDLQMHHMSAELGGTLTVYVLGEAAAERGAHVLAGLGYDVITGAVAE